MPRGFARGYGRDRAGLLAFGLLLAAARCGAPPQARPTPAPGPQPGGTLRLIQEVPSGLDPVTSESVYESLPVNQIFDTLVATDASLNVAPSLAEAWRISRDGLTYVFNLRRDVRFHDGHPFDAGDVVFTLDRVLREGGVDSVAYPVLESIRGAVALAAGEADTLEGVTRLDDYTVRLELVEADPLFLEKLAMDNLAIVPQHVLEGGDREAFARAPIGTGPFAFRVWDGDHILLRRNPNYFRADPHLDAVRINFYGAEEDDYGLARFTRGELDALEPTSKSYETLAAADSVDLYRFQELSLSFLGLNSSRPPMSETWFRRVIAHSIDHATMVAGSPSVRVHAPGILPPGIVGYTPEPKRLPFDPEAARRILADHGHADGAGLPPVRLCDPSKGAEPDAVVRQVIDNIEAVGLRVELQQLTWAEMSERLDTGTCPAFLLAWIADMSDPDAFLSGFGELGGGNFFMFEDPRSVELLDEAAREFEPGERGRRYREAEKHILEQAPLVPLYHTRGLLATQKGVHGLRPGPFGVAKLELEHVWLEHRGVLR